LGQASITIAGSEVSVKNHEPDLHVVLFSSAFLGREVNSPRLHHINYIKINRIEPGKSAPREFYVNSW
jgi:hypothetical protein